MLSAIAAAALLLYQDTRFELVAPFPGVRWAKIQTQIANVGLAQQLAHDRNLQARVMWVDGTANIEATNSTEEILALVKRLKEIGFNTIVYDVKPIVGYTMYPSKLTEQLLSWKGQSMPAGFDPLKHFVAACKAEGMTFYVAMNAFSEGHSYSLRDKDKPDTQFGKPGWGYEHPELQTTQYIALPTISPAWPDAPTWDIHPVKGATTPTATVSVWGRVPPADSGVIFAVLDMNRNVVSYGPPTAPKDGQIAVAFREPAASYLKSWLATGRVFTLGSRAEFKRIGEAQSQIPLMMNPHDPKNVERAQQFIAEVAANYDVDGVLYDDRLRFGGMNADFSPTTRAAFERIVGPVNWPDDVFRITFRPDLTQGVKPGKFFDAWLTFRAQAMSNAVSKFADTVQRTRPGTVFGIYAGSWYGDYVRYGTNYASPELNAGFPFLTRAYRQTGFAPKLDVLITGCYYKVGTTFEAMERELPVGRTVEAGGILSNRVARDSCWTYAGLMLADYWDDPSSVETALQAAAATTQGVMIFDLSHQFEKFEPILRRAFKKKVNAPHQVNGLLDILRQKRRELDAKGIPNPPFPLFEGAPGAGF